MKYYFYDPKHNTFYIATKVIMPKSNLSYNEMEKIFDLSYEERLEKYCPEDIRKEIEVEIEKHSGCKISEFTSI